VPDGHQTEHTVPLEEIWFVVSMDVALILSNPSIGPSCAPDFGAVYPEAQDRMGCFP
jgi:hypothetical protein